MARENYTTLRVRTEASEGLRRLVRRVAAEADRNVTQSEALDAAIAYALDHLADVAALLGQEGGRDSA